MTTTDPPDAGGDLLDEGEAGQYLNVPAGTLRQWRYLATPAGPPYVKVGPRHVRYRRADLDAWVDSNTVHPQAAS